MANRRGTRGRDTRPWTRGAVLVLVGILVVGSFGGGLSAVSLDNVDVDRTGNAPVAGLDTSDAAIGVTSVTSIQDGTNGQDLATVSNRLDSSATYTVEITPDAAENNVTFVSTTSVSVSGNGTVATVSFDPGESITLTVDVATNTSDVVDTADFVVEGGTDDGGFSATIDEQTGPDVVS